ncbi:MAG: hypothetical protein ACUVQK_04890, partial [Thermogutta sp.]
CKWVREQRVKSCTYQVCKMVPTTCVKRVACRVMKPVTCTKTVYDVCWNKKQVPYTVTRCVPRVVCEMVPVRVCCPVKVQRACDAACDACAAPGAEAAPADVKPAQAAPSPSDSRTI